MPCKRTTNAELEAIAGKDTRAARALTQAMSGIMSEPTNMWSDAAMWTARLFNDEFLRKIDPRLYELINESDRAHYSRMGDLVQRAKELGDKIPGMEGKNIFQHLNKEQKVRVSQLMLGRKVDSPTQVEKAAAAFIKDEAKKLREAAKLAVPDREKLTAKQLQEASEELVPVFKLPKGSTAPEEFWKWFERGTKELTSQSMLGRLEGPKGAKIPRRLAEIVNEVERTKPQLAKVAREDLRIIFNQQAAPTSLKEARSLMGVMSLGLSSITNLADFHKIFVMQGSDLSSAMGALRESFAAGLDVTAANQRAGISDITLVSHMARETGASQLLDSFLRRQGFIAIERKIRDVQGIMGRKVAQKMVDQIRKDKNNPGAIIQLKELIGAENIEQAVRKGLTEDMLDRAAFSTTRKLQPFGTMSVPALWQTPIGRTLTMFQSFNLKQFRFVTEHVAREALRGNPKPAIMFLILSQALGEPIADVKAVLTGRIDVDEEGKIAGPRRPGTTSSTEIARRMIDNWMEIGGIGLPSSILSSIRWNRMNPISATFAGPFFSMLDGIVTSGQKISNALVTTPTNKRKPKTPLNIKGVDVSREVRSGIKTAVSASPLPAPGLLARVLDGWLPELMPDLFPLQTQFPHEAPRGFEAALKTVEGPKGQFQRKIEAAEDELSRLKRQKGKLAPPVFASRHLALQRKLTKLRAEAAKAANKER